MEKATEANVSWQSRVRQVFELGQSLNAGLELPDLCQRIVDAAINLSDAQIGLLILTTPATSLYSVEAKHTPPGTAEYSLASIENEPLAAQVIEQIEPIILKSGDTFENAELTYTAENPEIYIPVLNQGDLTGVLGVKRPPNAPDFHENVVDLLIGLAGYAAVSLENGFLYQRAIELSRELSLLVESSNAISSSLDLSSVLNAIARYMTRALVTDWCTIHSAVSTDDYSFIRLAEYRNAVWQPGEGPIIELDQIAYSPDVELQDLLTPTQFHLQDSSEELAAALEARGIGRNLIVPLQAEGNIIGLVELVSQNDGTPFTPTQVNQSLRFALELALLFCEKPDKERRQRLIETSRMMLYNIYADWCNLYLFDNDRQSIRKWLSYGTGIWLEDSGPVKKINPYPTLTIVMMEQRIAVLRSDDPGLPQSECDLFKRVGTGCMLALPLVLKGRTVGLVQLHDLDPQREFPSRELALAYTLASQAAAALENARLVLDLQHSLTELKAMQGRMIHTARLSALGELAAVVAHQVNNPLTTVMGDAEILVQDIDEDHPNHASAKAILHAGRRAKDVVERILVMSRDEREFKDIDLNSTIEDSLQLVRPQTSRYHIKLLDTISPDIPPVRAIPGQLEDVWMNLLTNARDAVLDRNPKQGVITISSSLSDDGRMAVVTVSDNGSGIPAANLESVFDPLFTTKPRGKGTGLGLYVCRQIVDDHNGIISINSVPNEGTMITVQIPIATSFSEEV